MTASGIGTAAAFTAIGAVAGGILGGNPGLAIGAALGLAAGVAAHYLQVRPLVGISVAASGAVGAILGRSVVSVLCAPSGCPAAEWLAATVTAIGAVVGVGLVVALAMRSFDEYREAIEADRPPPTAGCESEEHPGPG